MKFLLIIFFLAVYHSGFTQPDTSLKLIQTINGTYEDFAVDNIGNILLLDKDNQLKKLSPKGDSISVYNDVKRYGKVYSIDANNPLKILLYYKDFGTVVILDRFLNIRNTIDLRKKSIFQAKAICQAYDNTIWVYDEGEAKLKKITDEGNIASQTGDLRLQVDEAPSPIAMEDDQRLVYLYDTAKGLLVFDYFGTLKNKIAFLGWQDFQLAGKYIIGRKGALLERYQLSTLLLEEKSLPIILKGAIKIRINASHLYCLKNGCIYIYSYN